MTGHPPDTSPPTKADEPPRLVISVLPAPPLVPDINTRQGLRERGNAILVGALFGFTSGVLCIMIADIANKHLPMWASVLLAVGVAVGFYAVVDLVSTRISRRGDAR